MEMKTWKAKLEVLKNKNNLKVTDIYIYSDLTKDRKINAEIRTVAKQ